MFTLSIEHTISDFPTWKRAFDRFAETRARAGVRSQRIRRPVGDPNYLVIELEFDDQQNADTFRTFLDHTELEFDDQQNADTFRTFLDHTVWTNRDASPALVGVPVTRILEAV